MKRKIVSTKVTCPRCKGKGVVYDHELSVFTAGIGLVLQALDRNLRIECSRCNGRGYLIKTTEILEDSVE